MVETWVICVVLMTITLFPFSIGTLLQEFLKHKSVKYVTLSNCDDYPANTKLVRSFTHSSIFASLHSSKKPNIRVDYHKTAFYLDTDCDNWHTVLQEMSERKLFNANNHWLLKTSNYSEVKLELSKLPLDIDSEVTVAVKKEDYFDLYEVYNSGFFNNGAFNSTRIGKLTNESGITIPNQWKYLRRANMTGVVLKCMIVITRKLVNERFEEYIEKPELTHIDSMNRFNYALLLHLKDIYNFRYSMMRTNSWGYLRNGTFDGMVGFLQRKQADIGGSPIFFRLERAKVIDYTMQTWISRPCFIFRHPKQVGSFYKIYTRPLDAGVWYCTLAVFSLMAAALRYLMKEDKRKHPDTAVDASWSFTVLAVLSAICQQGVAVGPSSATVRVVVFTWLLFALTIYQFYSASITSSLLMESPTSIRSLEDLLHSPLRAGIEDIVYNFDYFARTTDPVALELYKKKIVTPNGKNFFPAAEGLAMVKAGGFAFHVDIATAYRLIRETYSEREVCELVEVQLFPPQRMVAVVQKGSPYRKLVTYGLRKIAESGLMHRQKSVWHEPKPKCVRTPDSSIFSVTLHEFSTALVVLLSGVLMSLSLLTVEIIVHRRST